MRPGALPLSPPVDVPAARRPRMSSATHPTVSCPLADAEIGERCLVALQIALRRAGGDRRQYELASGKPLGDGAQDHAIAFLVLMSADDDQRAGVAGHFCSSVCEAGRPLRGWMFDGRPFAFGRPTRKRLGGR